MDVGAFAAAAWVTWKLTLISFALGLALGLVLTVLRLLPIRPLKAAIGVYIAIFRNIPTVALLIVIVFALPYLNVVIDYEPSVLLALVLVCAAFAADHLKSGINTVDPGQVEAAYSLGLGLVRTTVVIVLPQALRAVVQPMTSLLIALLLSTAIASQVPVSDRELTGLVDKINNESAGGLATFLVAAAFYVVSGLALSWLGAWVDRRVRIVR